MLENVINIYITLTFLWVLLNKVKPIELLLIMAVTVLNIIVSEVLLYNKMSIRFVTNLYFLLTLFLWMHLLRKAFKSNYANSIYILFGLGAIVTFSMYNITTVFNKMFVVVSSIIYVSAFLWLGYRKLILDQLSFFKTPKFMLLSAPIVFLLGMSLLWGFQNPVLQSYKVFGEVKLYTLINIIGNFSLYTFINIYVFKTRKSV